MTKIFSHQDKAALPKVILIGGSPFSGKTTIATKLAAKLGYCSLSTDDIGTAIAKATTIETHPSVHYMGTQDFREYYIKSSLEKMVEDATRSHEALWPSIASIIANHASWGFPIVIEGWALTPQKVSEVISSQVKSVWLVPTQSLLEERIKKSSLYKGASDEPKMIHQYIARCVWFNDYINASAARNNFPIIKLDEKTTIDETLNTLITSFACN